MGKNDNTETSTVEVPFDALTGLATVAEYVAGDRKSRAAMRKSIEACADTFRNASATALKAGDMAEALTQLGYAETVADHMTAIKASTGTVTVEFDYAAAIANRAATFRRAYALTIAGMFDVADEADVDMEHLPTGTVDADLLARLMGTPLRRNTKQNDVSALITAAFVGQPVGTRLSVADVVRHAAQNGSTVSPGAVTARATADTWTGHAGIVPMASTATAPIGFQNKVAIAESLDALTDDTDDTDGDA